MAQVIPGSYSTFDPEQSIFGSSHNEYYGTDKNVNNNLMEKQDAKIYINRSGMSLLIFEDEAEIMLNQYAKIIGFTLHRKPLQISTFLETQGSEQGLELVENDESYDLGNKLDINILVENEQFNNKTDYNFVKQLNNKTDNELVEALQEYEESKNNNNFFEKFNKA
ncbi:hypothetical protein C2G38_2175331 [Gigaspora rosea]|uniref:Uncharacterized protein n=1 Tax=Gigaspora rosea TaxID=44941 RepID=A0A397VPR9_9GLOM|nr:hypothetical protein C2G38_2175331 [Gigaspora rosea]